jgi:hypothetical protein
MELVQKFLTRNPCYQKNMNPPAGDNRWEVFQKRGPLGLMLHSIGCPQPAAMVLINNWNREDYNVAAVHAFIDGRSGIVYQTLPWNFRGWHGGGSSNNTHVGVEMCEPDCIRYTSGSNFTCSNLEVARSVANRTYNSAVELFARLCVQFGLDPLGDGVIVSHAEGYRRGIATNHGDPEHLWRGLGLPYTMDGFRKDVYSKIHEKEGDEDMPRYDTVEQLPKWAQEDIQKLIDLGYLKGRDGGKLDLTEDMIRTLIICGRMMGVL